jgi:hypothetical protein
MFHKDYSNNTKDWNEIVELKRPGIITLFYSVSI